MEPIHLHRDQLAMFSDAPAELCFNFGATRKVTRTVFIAVSVFAHQEPQSKLLAFRETQRLFFLRKPLQKQKWIWKITEHSQLSQVVVHSLILETN